MKYEKVDLKNCESKQWSGGITTPLYTLEDDDDKNTFLLRLSVAEIRDSSSKFTKLPKVHRTLMVLDGQLNLNFNSSSQDVNQFESVSFEGDWPTTSAGKSRVFNAMTTGTIKPQIRHQELKSEEIMTVSSAHLKLAIFVANGTISLEGEILSDDQLLILPADHEISIEAIEKGDVLIITFD